MRLFLADRAAQHFGSPAPWTPLQPYVHPRPPPYSALVAITMPSPPFALLSLPRPATSRPRGEIQRSASLVIPHTLFSEASCDRALHHDDGNMFKSFAGWVACSLSHPAVLPRNPATRLVPGWYTYATTSWSPTLPSSRAGE